MAEEEEEVFVPLPAMAADIRRLLSRVDEVQRSLERLDAELDVVREALSTVTAQLEWLRRRIG